MVSSSHQGNGIIDSTSLCSHMDMKGVNMIVAFTLRDYRVETMSICCYMSTIF